jgi:rhomboid family GlyGly-CTERM serine protease
MDFSFSDSWRQRQVLFPLLLIIFVLAAQLVDGNDLFLLRYQRDDIFAWQFWRLVSGHLVHATWMHLALNLAGLVVVWLLFKDIINQRIWWLLTLGSIAGVDIGLLVFNPEIKWYVGLSGVLHGLFAGGAILQIRLNGARGWLYLILLIIKLLWEHLSGPLPGSGEMSGARVITEAHLYGALGGAVVIVGLIVANNDHLKRSHIHE